MQSLYIYYRVRADQHAAALACVRRIGEQLLASTGQKSRLLWRPKPEPADVETWMEVYENVSADTVRRLEELVEAEQLNALLSGPRHVECFVELDS
ncbi:MAG: DUF4936 family protein [Burkholderiaceae bacterium]